MSGFVYLWRDRKHNRYYVGSHWGDQNDGYVCSSKWMLRARSRRPWDFKRRILKIITTSRSDLLVEESRWLCMIKSTELKGKRYYNLLNHQFNHWTSGDNTLSIREKISKSKKGKKNPNCSGSKHPLWGKHLSDETKRKMSEVRKGHPFYGNRQQSEETKQKISMAKKGQSAVTIMTDEIKQKISQTKIGKPGHPHSEQEKQRIRERQSKYWVITKPTGESIRIMNLQQFCKQNSLNSGNMRAIAEGKRSHHKGWKCEAAA